MNDVVNETNSRGKNNSLLIAVILLILVAAGVGAWLYFEKGPGQVNTPTTNEELPAVVAKVNGVEIDRGTYERNLDQMRAAYAAQGADVTSASSSAELKQITLDSLVNRKLFLMAAQNAKLSVENSAIETEYQNAITSAGGQEAFDAALVNAGLNEKMVKEDIKDGLLIQQYLNTALKINEITVSEEEILNLYNSVKATNPEVPELAEVKAEVETQVLNSKKDEVINAALQSMRANANIEILI